MRTTVLQPPSSKTLAQSKLPREHSLATKWPKERNHISQFPSICTHYHLIATHRVSWSPIFGHRVTNTLHDPVWAGNKRSEGPIGSKSMPQIWTKNLSKLNCYDNITSRVDADTESRVLISLRCCFWCRYHSESIKERGVFLAWGSKDIFERWTGGRSLWHQEFFWSEYLNKNADSPKSWVPGHGSCSLVVHQNPNAWHWTFSMEMWTTTTTTNARISIV
jgi:hypothetical protein